MHHPTRTISGIFMAAGLLLANPVVAVDFGNMMNPSKWMGGNKDRGDDYYDGPPPGYGYGGAPGYGGEPGYGYGGAPGGYGGAPGGYGGAPGGYGGAPGGYGGAPGGYGGEPGYGYGGAPGGYGGAPGGYGGEPGYGYGGAPGGYGTAPAYGAPAANPDAAEIERLKQRIKKLEEASKAPQPPQTGGSPYPVPPTPYYGNQEHLFK